MRPSVVTTKAVRSHDQGAADKLAYEGGERPSLGEVLIRGDYHRSREVIAKGHQDIVDSIYRGSRVAYELLQA